jgi:hypothetical protein
MRAWNWLFCGFAIATLSCSSSDKKSAAPPQTTKAVAEALTTSVDFDNGKVKDGELPAATAKSVMLAESSEALTLQPSESATMLLDVDNPDEAKDPVAATLIQFEDSTSHVEIPRSKADAGMRDAGSSTTASGTVHLDNKFKLGAEVCKDFCNKTFDVKMFMAVLLGSGKVSQHSTRSFTLDCTKDGDSARCDKDAGIKKGTAGKPSTTKVDAGKRDSGGIDNSVGEMLAAAYAGLNAAICSCAPTDKTNVYCDAAPFSMTEVACIKAQVNMNSSMACVSSKVTCDVAAINSLANTCKACGCTNPNQMLGAALAAETCSSHAFTIPGIKSCMLNLGDAGMKMPAADAGSGDGGAKDAGQCGQ